VGALAAMRTAANVKFKVLVEGVKHHSKEEEGEIFPGAARVDMDFNGLGDQTLQRPDAPAEG
jgi:hypothetical protein